MALRNDPIFEIEYFCGIDVDNLDHIPAFETGVGPKRIKTWAYWPGQDEPMHEYNVYARYERPKDGVVHLVVRYDEKNNADLVKRYPLGSFYWGTNTIVLKRGKRKGKCRWLEYGKTQPVPIRWEAFDVEGNSARPRAVYSESRRQERQEHFRALILACDDNRCALTGERTKQALEAAHLVPANGENDEPFNGITLRVDLHRLFDAGLFTFKKNGQVRIPAQARLSPAYRGCCASATSCRNRRSIECRRRSRATHSRIARIDRTDECRPVPRHFDANSTLPTNRKPNPGATT